MTGAVATYAAALVIVMTSVLPVRAEKLVVSLSSHVVQITSNFHGVELVLFGVVEADPSNENLRTNYDLVATTIGPRQAVVARRKERMFGIWVNSESRTFADVPSYVSVASNRPLEEIADDETLRRQQIGLENAALPGITDSESVPPDQDFRQAVLQAKAEHLLYGETLNGVTFLTPTLFRTSIFLPAEAQIGTYDVTVKLFADGVMIATAKSAFEIDTVGFERFIAFAAVDHGVMYGLATAFMAIMTGWIASIVFRRD